MAQISIELQDESKKAFLLELFSYLDFVKVISVDRNVQVEKAKPKPSKKTDKSLPRKSAA